MKILPVAVVESTLVFLAVTLIYVASPTWSAADSHFVLPTALSMIRHGDANIDEYRARFSEAPWAVYQERGHYWNLYPVGTPIMVIPAVWLWDRMLAFQGRDLEALLTRGYPIFAEEVLASVITALTGALLFWYARDKLSLPRALLLTALFGFGTSAYSTASRGLWQHGPSMLLIMLATLLYGSSAASRWTAALAGLAAGFSWAVRPSNLVLLLGFAALFAWERRAHLWAYLSGAAIGVLPLFVYNFSAFGTWDSYYSRILISAARRNSFHWNAILGTAISPSRGLFVFCPFFLWVALRAVNYFRARYPVTRLELMLAGVAVIWWVGVARMPNWWGGGSVGPRLLCEVMLCAAILLIPVVKELSLTNRRAIQWMTAGFVVAGALSVAINLRCAVAQPVVTWLQRPVGLDANPGRLWDWHDPQFLREMGR